MGFGGEECAAAGGYASAGCAGCERGGQTHAVSSFLELFFRTQIAPLAHRQIAQFDLADADPLESDHLESDGFAHAPDLAVPPLVKNNLEGLAVAAGARRSV